MAETDGALTPDALLAGLARKAAAAAKASPRFSEALFAEAVEGPSTTLLGNLRAAGWPEKALRALVGSHLRLSAEAVVLGRPVGFPWAEGSFLSLALASLVPRLLPAMEPRPAVEALAALFNLGENLLKEPRWLERVFCDELSGLGELTDLGRRVGEVEASVTGPPATPLGEPFRVRWADTSEADRRFLPGPLHFLHPTVLCVHDRLRGPVGKRPPETCAIRLSDPPVVLGHSGCSATPALSTHQAVGLVARAGIDDPRISERFATAANDWRAAVTLKTSQMVVVLLPEEAP